MRNWSMYIQSPEELDLTRKRVFSDKNNFFWKNVFNRVDKPKKILEVGCGGGILSRKMASIFSHSEIYGVDYDTGHIEYARNKALSLGISNCIFEVADATNLPYQNSEFDICISHTVMNFCEPHKFLSEQKRILKKGGLIVVCLAKSKRCINPHIWMPESGLEYELLMKLKNAADSSTITNVTSYHTSEDECLKYLHEEGFVNIDMQILPNIIYFPDSCEISFDEGLEQIKDNLHLEEIYIEKLLRISPCALSGQEISDLKNRMKERYNRRLEQYINHLKQWDFSASLTFVASAINPDRHER